MTKTGRTAFKTAPGTRCEQGFRRGQSKKAGPSDKTHCVQKKAAATGSGKPKRHKKTGKFVPASTPVGSMVEEI